MCRFFNFVSKVLIFFWFQDPKIPDRNRGFAFVEYYNHACAEIARRNMTRPDFRLKMQTPTVTWAEPKAEPDASFMSSVWP